MQCKDMTRVSTYAENPKSISLTNVERTTLTASRCRITFSGKLTPRSGSQKTVKYRISYEREEGVEIMRI